MTDPALVADLWMGRAKRVAIVVTAPIWFPLVGVAATLAFFALILCWAAAPLFWFYEEALCPLGNWVWRGEWS